jgi:hypothetical protein
MAEKGQIRPMARRHDGEAAPEAIVRFPNNQGMPSAGRAP